MARQDGVIQLTGSIGNLSFYKSQDGYLVRKKSGVSRERIMTDRAYARTRENIAEFARAATATKLLRSAFSEVIRSVADNRVTSRLTSALMKVIKSDETSARGQRNVANGDITLLEGFEFNKNTKLTSAFGAPFKTAIDPATGSMQITIPAFDPRLISAPQDATDFRLKAVGAAINFEKNTISVAATQSVRLRVGQVIPEKITLSHNVTSQPGDRLLLTLGVEFFEMANGAEYPLNSASGNAMALLKAEMATDVGLSTNEVDGELKMVKSVTQGECLLVPNANSSSGLGAVRHLMSIIQESNLSWRSGVIFVRVFYLSIPP